MDRINELLIAVANSDELAKELESTKDMQEFVKVAADYGFELSKQDLEIFRRFAEIYVKQQDGDRGTGNTSH